MIDSVEAEYLRAIRAARDDEKAIDLAIGLQQYRDLFKTTPRDEDE